MQGTLEDVYVRMFCAHAPRHAPLVWGNPPFRVRFVRLSGVVVARERTSLTLDDSTGLACVRYGDSAELQRTAATLELGAPIDVLGGLVVDTGGVCVDAIAIVSRADDALAEVVTALETMDAYRHYYRATYPQLPAPAALVAVPLSPIAKRPRLDPHADDDAPAVDSALATKVASALSDGTGLDLAELARECGVDSARARDALDSMILQGLVYVRGDRYFPL